MAQTQLNRVYVQTIDSTGTTDPTLSLGVKSLTTTVKIGGIGTGGNSINVSSTGINMSGPLNALGQTNLQNTSILNVGVTGQTTLQNTSINGTLNAAGLATLINVSTTSLSVLNNVSVGGNVSVTGNLYVSSTMILPTLTVGSNAVLENASIMGTLKATKDLTTLKNVSVNETLDVVGLTTLNGLTVNQGANFYNSVGIANNSLSITGTGGFSVAGQTTLQNTSVQGLTASGKTWLSNTSITGQTDINVTGTATTTIGNVGVGKTQLNNATTNVSGTLTVTGATTLGGALTVGGSHYLDQRDVTLKLGASGLDGNIPGIRIRERPSQTINTVFFPGNDYILCGQYVDIGNEGTGVDGNKFIIKNNGNVGISNSNPTSTLDVIGTMKVTGTTNINATGGLDTTIGTTGSGTTSINSGTTTISGSAITVGSSATGTIYMGDSQTSGDIRIGLSSSRTGDINIGNNMSSGNIKIGNNFATTNPVINIGTTNKGGIIVRGTNVRLCDDGGNVGIGTTAPAGVLDVTTSNVNRLLTVSTPTNTSSDTATYTGTNLMSMFNAGYQSSELIAITGGYRYSTSNSDSGKISTNITTSPTYTYKVVFTLKATTPDTYLHLELGNNNTMFSLGLIGTSAMKTYTSYFTSNSTISAYIVLSGALGNRVRTIEYQWFSIEPFYHNTMNSLNVTGPIRASGPCDFIVTTSTFNCPILRADAITVSTTEYATVRYTPINSNSAFVSIQLRDITQNFRGFRITTDQFPLLKGLTTIPIFTIPIFSARGLGTPAVDNNLFFQALNLFFANRIQGIGFYNAQLGGSNTDITMYTSVLPNNGEGSTSFYLSGVTCINACGVIGV